MLTIFPLNEIEPILSSSKEENVLWKDPFIEYPIFESCLSCSFLVWAQNLSMDCKFPYQSLFKQCSVLELQVCSYCLNIGQGQLSIDLIM